jgi:hypothetical protein
MFAVEFALLIEPTVHKAQAKFRGIGEMSNGMGVRVKGSFPTSLGEKHILS